MLMFPKTAHFQLESTPTHSKTESTKQNGQKQQISNNHSPKVEIRDSSSEVN
jgi:hypothetical protein